MLAAKPPTVLADWTIILLNRSSLAAIKVPSIIVCVRSEQGYAQALRFPVNQLDRTHSALRHIILKHFKQDICFEPGRINC